MEEHKQQNLVFKRMTAGVRAVKMYMKDYRQWYHHNDSMFRLNGMTYRIVIPHTRPHEEQEDVLVMQYIDRLQDEEVAKVTSSELSALHKIVHPLKHPDPYSNNIVRLPHLLSDEFDYDLVVMDVAKEISYKPAKKKLKRASAYESTMQALDFHNCF